MDALGIGSNVYSFIWLIFILFVGTALAVDIGVLDKAKKFSEKLLKVVITKVYQTKRITQ
jgi:hypothetical protein